MQLEEVTIPMHRSLFRAVAGAVAATVIITGITTMTDSATAEASHDGSRFVLTTFPHDTTDVGFSNTWGNRRSGGRRHQGTDIMSPRGTEVVAVADGVVTKLGTHRMSGYFIRIDHGGRWMTVYMHLNNDTLGTDDGEGGTWTAFQATLMEGDEVRAGQVIGYVGDSGNAEGARPHTHFEIRHDGRKLNPYRMLRDVWERQHRFPTPEELPF